MEKIRIIDIARKAGVSAGTVDRVIHERGEVSEDTRNKILKIINELGYTPDLVARALASKKKIKIGILIPDKETSSSYWSYPEKGMNTAINEIKHFGITASYYLFNLHQKESFEDKAAAMLKSGVDAVVIAPLFKNEASSLIDNLHHLNIPCVLVDTDIPDSASLSYVGQNSYKSGRVAAQLLSYSYTGKGDVLILTIARAHENMSHLQQRVQGFKDYFNTVKNKPAIYEVTVNETSDLELFEVLDNPFKKEISIVFVPNSRAFKVADYLSNVNKLGVKILGFDILEQNKEHLMKGNIDFLINQRPEDQGYIGIMTLYNKLVVKKEIERYQYSPIEIITSENIEFVVK
jgi:LacI family transcriptional regulator